MADGKIWGEGREDWIRSLDVQRRKRIHLKEEHPLFIYPLPVHSKCLQTKNFVFFLFIF